MTVLAAMLGLPGMQVVFAQGAPPPPAVGDVYASTCDKSGKILRFRPDGTLAQTLDTNSSACLTGSVFDGQGNFYVTDFFGGTIVKFDPTGKLIGPIASGLSTPESIVFDSSGNIYVSEVGDGGVVKLDASGNSLATFAPGVRTDWIDLASDQCTIFYTAEGTSVMRFNVCTNTQLADFADNLPGGGRGSAFALRIRPSGDVIVADSDRIVRLNVDGTVIQTYGQDLGETIFFAANLDPDGTSFWSADALTGDIYRFDIASGNVLKKITGNNTETTGLTILGQIAVAVKNPPTCTLTVDNNSGPAPFTIHVTAASCQPGANGGSLRTATLDFGDGSPQITFKCDGNCPPGTPFTGSHSYQNAGTFTATMSTTDSNQMKASAAQTITVTPPVDSTPKCTLGSDKNNGGAPLTVSFQGACTDAGNDFGEGSRGSLDFGDKTPPQAVPAPGFGAPGSPSVSHQYANPGTFVATYTSTDDAGLTGKAMETITVVDSTPKCQLTAKPTSGQAPLTVAFNGACTDAGNDLNEKSTFNLDFGDGTPASTNAQATHVYQKAGPYTATFTATDASNHTSAPATAAITVTAPPQAPTCTLTVTPDTGPAPLAITATGNCTDPQNQLTGTTLDFGDGTIESDTASGTHTYSKAGSFTVTLTGTDQAGLKGSASQNVMVTQPTPPTCTLTFDNNTGPAPFTVNATASCSDPQRDAQQGSISWGDGSPDSPLTCVEGGCGFTGPHTYKTPGMFTAVVTDINAAQQKGTATQTVTVNPPIDSMPKCQLNSDTQNGPAPLTVNFTGNCTDAGKDLLASGESLDFGDGTPPQPGVTSGSHIYTKAGPYTATLTATDESGKIGSASVTIMVVGPDSTPMCTLTAAPQNGVAPLTVKFTGNCVDAGNDLSPSGETLDFGDGTPPLQGAATSSATHTYATAGNFSVKLSAKDDKGFTSNATLSIVTTADQPPVCTLSVKPGSGLAPLAVTATGNCTDPENQLTGTTLDFGDGTVLTTASGMHTYPIPGNFTVKLTGTDKAGLTTVVSQTVMVTMAPNLPPACKLAVAPADGPAPLAVTATGACTDPENDIVSTTLSFGDNTPAQSGASGTHTYATPGNFTVTLTATDAGGLMASATQSVIVSAPINLPPTCTVSATPAMGTVPLPVTITGSCSDPENDITTVVLDFGDKSAPQSFAPGQAVSATHTYQNPGTATVTLTATDAGNLTGTATQAVLANTLPLLVAGSNGMLREVASDGTLIQTIDTGAGGTITGMGFDPQGNVYATAFTAANVFKFDSTFKLIGAFGSGYNCKPESIVFDRSGNAYVGQAGCSHQILKFAPNGSLAGTFNAATEDQGTDWIDISSDQCTLLYTSEGTSILRFDVCKNQQLTTFTTGLQKALSLRILPDGGVVVANLTDIVRFNSSGQMTNTYTAPGEQCWDALTLDPDGVSFWAADFCSSNIYHFDLASGNQLAKFNAGTPPNTIFGIAMNGTGLNNAGNGAGGTLAANPQSANVSIGGSAQFAISINPSASALGQTFALSCGDLPPGTKCSFSPPTITPTAAVPNPTSALTVTTSGTASLFNQVGMVFAICFGFAGIVFSFHSPKPRTRLLSLVVVMLLVGTWAGCGSSGTVKPAPAATLTQGSYTIVVLGTSGQMQASTTVQLNVQ